MRKGRVITIGFMALIIALLAVSVAACATETSVQQVDREAQETVLARGQDAEPVYQIQNFLSRRAINAWLERVDTPDKLWYIYLQSESGAFVGYHICNTIPLSYGVGITNPKQKVVGGNGNVVMPAPGLDAVFYGGTDPSVHYCFDAESDALVTFNTKFVYYDKPLDLDVPRLRLEVETVPDEN